MSGELACTIILVALAAAYAYIQLRFWWRWRQLPESTPVVHPAIHRWTVLVAARNEADSIASCMSALFNQQLAPAEIIVLDDHSTDDTSALVQAAGSAVKLVQLGEGEGGKKAALQKGVQRAQGTWIATVDADVRVPPTWLSALNAACQQDQVAVAAPVALGPTSSWFDRWQALDFCGMMAITAASIQAGQFAMGNGANLAFAKAAYHEVGGYEQLGGVTSASGDDMVLLGKLLERYPGQLAFAKTPAAEVETKPQPTLGAFVQQRWRWSAKTGLNQQPALTLTLAVVWFFHLALFAGCLALASGWMEGAFVLGAWVTKLAVDLVLLRSATRFFRKESLLGWEYPISGVVHAAYVAGIGLLALLPIDFTWKGRRHRA